MNAISFVFISFCVQELQHSAAVSQQIGGSEDQQEKGINPQKRLKHKDIETVTKNITV